MNLSATIVVDTQNASALDALRLNVDGLKQQLGSLQSMFTGLRGETMRPLVNPAATTAAADGLKQIGTEAKKAASEVEVATEALELRPVPAAARAAATAIKEVTVAARQAGAAGEEATRKLRLRAPAPAERAPLRLAPSFGLEDQRNAVGLRPRPLLRLPEWANVRGRVTLQDMTGPGAASARVNFMALRQQLQGLQMAGAGLRGGGLLAASDGIGSLVSGLGRVAPAAGAAAAALAPLAIAGGLVAAGLPKASEMEDLEVSLTTLIGSTQAAQQRLAELADFAEKTPFELPDVARASKVLQTLTGGALATGAGLRMVGDVAANTGQPFADLAVWIGRTWDGLQNGRPVGEALMRLQELGVMSSATRARIEEMQKAGQKGDAVWQVAAASFAKFAGEMDRRSATLSGRASNLKDATAAFLREWGGPALEPAKAAIGALTSLVESLTDKVRVSKAAFNDLFGIGAPKTGAGLENMKGFVDRARAVDSIAGKEQLVADIQREILRLKEEAAKNTDYDYGQALTQAEKLLAFVKRINAARLTDPKGRAAAQADALAEAQKTAPQDRAAIEAARRAMADANDAARMEAEKGMAEREAIARRRAWRAGAAASPFAFQGEAGTLEEAKKRLEQLASMLAKEAANDPLGLKGAAEQMEKIRAAHEQVLSLQRQITAARKEAMERAVADTIEEIYGSGKNNTGRAGNRLPDGDRLAKIGLFVGGAGGPALDFARRTAVGVEKLHALIRTNVIPLARPIETGYI